MSTSKVFRFAGVSTRNGVTKARFSDRVSYTEALKKAGDINIDLVELPHAMTKADAVAYLLSINFDNGNATVRTALDTNLAKRQPKAKIVKQADTAEA